MEGLLGNIISKNLSEESEKPTIKIEVQSKKYI